VVPYRSISERAVVERCSRAGVVGGAARLSVAASGTGDQKGFEGGREADPL
jgi:hypothetical protein